MNKLEKMTYPQAVDFLAKQLIKDRIPAKIAIKYVTPITRKLNWDLIMCVQFWRDINQRKKEYEANR